MESFANVAGQALTWIPSKTTRRAYELRAGDTVVATLEQPSAWRSDRVGTAADGAWRFTMKGFLRSQLIITDAQSGAEVAAMSRPDWAGKGTLTLPDGRRYQWRNGNVWRSKWIWLDAQGQPLAHFKESTVLRTRCEVEIASAAWADPHVALLAILGWQIMLLINQSRAAATAATVAAIN